MKKLIENKFGVEMSLTVVVSMILAVIVLVILIAFFVTHYNAGSTDITNISQGAFDAVNN